MEVNEELCINLYRNYGITEWPEKCNVLTFEEQKQVLCDLETEKKTDLVRLVLLPFPSFVNEYFKGFPNYQKYFSDPACGFKLYFLSPSRLRAFAERMRDPYNATDAIEKYGYRCVRGLRVPYVFTTPLEDLLKEGASTDKKKEAEKKFAYLTQYIDYEMAKKLGLKIADTFLQDGIDGYGLYEKLELLPPSLKTVMIEYLGLYGHIRKSADQILEKYNLIQRKEDRKNFKLVGGRPLETINSIFPYFLRPLGEFKNYLGYHEDMQTEGNMAEYSKQNIRDMMISFEIKYIFHNLPDSAISVLSKMSSKERVVYLIAKYMYKTPESLARNAVITPVAAKKFLMKMKEEK